MRSLWTSPRALRLHLTAAVVVPGCIALAGWQATRALGGNTLSWAYTFEWPVFGAYAVYMWWKLLHEQPAATPADEAAAADGAGEARAPGVASAGHTEPAPGATADLAADAPTGPTGQGATPVVFGDVEEDGEESEEEAAYNEYLAALHASGRRKHW